MLTSAPHARPALLRLVIVCFAVHCFALSCPPLPCLAIAWPDLHSPSPPHKCPMLLEPAVPCRASLALPCILELLRNALYRFALCPLASACLDWKKHSLESTRRNNYTSQDKRQYQSREKLYIRSNKNVMSIANGRTSVAIQDKKTQT